MPLPREARNPPDPSRFTYARLYCGPDGNTHFQDATAELRKTDFAPPAPPIHIGSDFPASRAFFGGFDARWGSHDLENRLNHPTPRLSSALSCRASFPSPRPTARRDNSVPAAYSGWRTLHPARDTSRSSATSLDTSCSFAESRAPRSPLISAWRNYLRGVGGGKSRSAAKPPSCRAVSGSGAKPAACCRP